MIDEKQEDHHAGSVASLHPNNQMSLYGHPLTHNPIKIQLVISYMAHESEQTRKYLQDVEFKYVALNHLEHKQTEFQMLNPNGKIPVLVHGDLTLWESNAIAQYLANYFNSTLWPYGADQQASVLRWLLWETGCWEPVAGNILLNEFYLPFWGYPGDETKRNKNRQKFEKLAQLLNAQLKKSRCINGDEFTLADLCIAAPLMHYDAVDFDFSPYAALQNWRALLSQQPWWQEVHKEVAAFQHSSQASNQYRAEQ